MYSMQRSLSIPPSYVGNASNAGNKQWTPLTPQPQRRRSNSMSNCVIERKRGFRPSDRFDPVKKEFLLRLGQKIWRKTVRIWQFQQHTQTDTHIRFDPSAFFLS